MRARCKIAPIFFSIFLGAGLAGYFLFSDSAFAAPAFEGTLPVKARYELAINLSADRRLLAVGEKMSVKNTTEEAWERLVFSMPPAAARDVFTLERLSFTLGGETFTAQPSIRGSMLSFAVPGGVPVGGEIVVDMSFKLRLKKVDPRDIHPLGNLGYGTRVTQCGDCFPTLTPYEPGRGFREWEFAPVGDPYLYPLADYAVEITTAPDMVIAAAGFLSRSGGTWRFVLENARSCAFLASPSYVRLSREADGIEIDCYYVKGNERAGQAMLQTAAECLELYGELYGPYPFRRLVVAQNAYHSAMEYSGLVTISNDYILSYTEKNPQLLLFIVSHEIAHQWWYGAVGSDQVAEPWLDESLAKYSEFLYFRAYHPRLREWWQKLITVRRPANRYIDDTIYDFTAAPADYTRVIYGLAPAFIQELHQKIGEEAFFAFLKDYYNYGKDRFVTAADFFSVLSRHTEEDITPLLKKYFRIPPRMKKNTGGD